MSSGSDASSTPGNHAQDAQSHGPSHALPPVYTPADHESRIRARWEAARVFHPDPARVLSGQAQPYCVLIPPPNVTAALHLGHALNNTLQDILVRAHRMRGHETLWMVGTDHAGIATQAVVEKRVWAEEKKRRSDFTREQFVAKVQAFKDEYEATITNQLKLMGCSCDWERQRFTMDPQCARAVYEAFFRLFKDRLIYRGKRLVNWDPVLQTAVADDECYDQEIDGNFYYLRYPLVHAVQPRQDALPVTWSELRRRGWNQPEDADHEGDAPAWITVATTRPETYFGDTAVAINPHDPRAGALRGLRVELPLIGRIIPIVEDSYVVLPERFARNDEEKNDPKARMATGFLKVTPAHDPNDWEIGQRHKLPVINVFAPDATISDKHGWSHAQELKGAQHFLGKTREEARKQVVIEFKARGWHEATKPYRHSVKHSDRSKAVVEPYLSDQWYVKVTDPRMAHAANEALQTGGASHELSAQPPRMVGRASPPAEGHTVDSEDTIILGARSANTPVRRASRGGLPHAWDQGIGRHQTNYIRRLPHFQKGGSTYFVTFRVCEGQLSPTERQLVLEACYYWNTQRAYIYAVSVMPDHVHMLLRPMESEPGKWHTLGDLMHSIKSYTAHEINRARGVNGSLWQDEWYDRIVRDADEFEEKLRYIENNAVEQGLAEKPGGYPCLRVTRTHKESADPHAAGGDARPTGAEPAFEATASTLAFTPERYAKTYQQWHEGIRDWCISRQLWWGHQVPVWSKVIRGARGTLNNEHAQWVNFRSQQDPSVSVRAFFNGREVGPTEVLDDGELVVHACIQPSDTKSIADFEFFGFTRDPDVLDTWFSSALWPLSTMGWPDDTALLRAFNPTSVLCTAREIITLWVSRMVMFNRYLHGEGNGRGPVPFHDVFIHAVIQDGNGQKMSKSLGNGVDPLDIIASHGGDALRFTLAHMATQTQDVRLPVDLICPHTGEVFPPKIVTNSAGLKVHAPIQTAPSDPTKKMVSTYGLVSGEAKPTPDMPLARNTSSKFDLGKRLCNKLWNASRLALSKLPAESTVARASSPAILRENLSTVDHWMLARLEATILRVDKALAEYQFADYAAALYDLIWRDFCDWYLEAIKPTIDKDANQQAVLAHALEVILRLAHPAMPFVTEAIWERLRVVQTAPISGFTLPPARSEGLLCTAGWPSIDPAIIDRDAGERFERIRTVIESIRELRATMQVKTARRPVLHLPQALGAELQPAATLIATLAGLARLTTDAAPTGAGTAKLRLLGEDAALSDLTDVSAASADISGEVAAKRLAELRKQHATITARLANPGYLERAPAKLVEESRSQLKTIELEIAALQSGA